MSYTSSILTYPIYDLNSSEFVTLLKQILEVEFNNQIDNHSIDFLPTTVETDSYLLSPVSDTEIDPAFVSIIKAKMTRSDYRYHNQNLP